jgi:hypothetical protein
MTYTNNLVFTTLKLIPPGSLLQLDYIPEGGVRAEVARGAALLGTEPTTYIVELTSVGKNVRGQPYFRGKALNRGGEMRTFAPFKGQLRELQVLRLGQSVTAD